MNGDNRMLKRAIIGAALTIVALLIGFLVAGLGHGWGAPFFYSFGLLLVYPIVLIRNLSPSRQKLGIDLALVILAIAANVMLGLDLMDRTESVRWRETESIVPGVDRSVFPFFVIWVAIWLFWQAVAVRTLWQDFAVRPAA